MEHRTLGRSGLAVSRIAFGAMTLGDAQGFMKGVTSAEAEGRRILDRALDAGLDTVDTANVYSEGQSEEILGRWLEGKRERVVLATKCRFPTHGTVESAADHVYLYQVHMQDRSVPIEEPLSALDQLVRQGKVRYVGCSNYAGYRLVEALWAADRLGLERYASVQLQWS